MPDWSLCGYVGQGVSLVQAWGGQSSSFLAGLLMATDCVGCGVDSRFPGEAVIFYVMPSINMEHRGTVTLFLLRIFFYVILLLVPCTYEHYSCAGWRVDAIMLPPQPQCAWPTINSIGVRTVALLVVEAFAGHIPHCDR